MSKLSNCLRMIELLMARGKMKIEELSQELEVKERMIREYKLEIEKSGIFIESEPGPNGGYYINGHSVLPVKNFSAAELNALNISVNSSLSKKNNNDNYVLKLALDKVNALQRGNNNSNRHFYFANKYLINNDIGNESKNFQKLFQAFNQK